MADPEDLDLVVGRCRSCDLVEDLLEEAKLAPAGCSVRIPEIVARYLVQVIAW